MRILLVEDNETLAEWLAKSLRRGGYTVDCVHNGEDADLVLRSESFSLIILDLQLPKMEGQEVMRRLRARNDGTPVLILSANNSMQSRVNELNHGADDYMAKPFEMEELEARIRVLLRRAANVVKPVITIGALKYDTNTKEFSLAGKALALTPREHAVLEILLTRAGTTVPKQTLVQSMQSLDTDLSADAIEIYVHRVRKKLEPGTVKIVTLRGLGYLLRDMPDVS